MLFGWCGVYGCGIYLYLYFIWNNAIAVARLIYCRNLLKDSYYVHHQNVYCTYMYGQIGIATVGLVWFTYFRATRNSHQSTL